MAKNFKTNGLGVLSIVFALAGAVLSIGNKVISDKQNQAYLDSKFEDWTKSINKK